MESKEMPMTEVIATITGQMRKAYLISGISTFLLIATYKLRKTKI